MIVLLVVLSSHQPHLPKEGHIIQRRERTRKYYFADDAWANYKSKIAHYGPAADPFPIVKKLRDNIKTVTDEGLQLGLTDAFAMIRDRHTRWTNMAPYGCFHTTTGVRFAFIEGDANIAKRPTVVVTCTSTSSDLLALFGEDYSKIEVGDELLAINGLSFVEWFDQNKFEYGFGANVFGGQRNIIGYLTMIYGAISRLPSEDFITFQFKSRTNPETIYTVTVPYVSGRDEDCWDLGSKLYKSLTGETLPGTPETSLPVSAEQPEHSQESDTVHPSTEGHEMDNSEDHKRGADMGEMSSSSQKSAVLMNPTGVTKIRWGIYKPESANMGIIRLDDFNPEDVGTMSLAVPKATMIIRSLLANELKDTHSVMYDLRGNSGGNAEFANSMVQLFKPDFQPFGDRYLMNKITHNLFVNGKDPNVYPFAKAWKETESGSRFTNVFFTSSVESVNTLGQAYPALWGSSMMQGATLPAKYSLVASRDTVPEPSLEKMIVRTGLYKGQDIEDRGIKTEFIFRPRWSDLQPDPTTNTQYDRIAASLARIGRKNGQSRLHFISEPFSIVNPIGVFSLEVEAAGIERFTVFQADGKTVIAKKRRRSATDKQKFSIPVSAVGSALGNNRITIVGKTAGKQVLKTIRNVRTIPTDDNYMRIDTPGFTFAGISDSVGLYQSSTTSPGNGWNNLKGPWVIGNGVKYASDVDSSLEAFFTAPVGTEINIGLDVDLDTELDFDFLYLSVKSSGGVEDFLTRSKSRDGTKAFYGISGRSMMVKETFPFTTKSEQFSVSLRFISDEATEFIGSTINSFTVSVA
ncbi:hypothetical protein BASA81_011459 [Batrachochytrium salamandrivorans]|nr:hypothetical protein BASA81_011459 [Batrachochytrium salamandrivorans]